MGREYRPKGINECKGIGARDGSGPTLGQTHEKGIGCDREAAGIVVTLSDPAGRKPTARFGTRARAR